MRSDSFQLFRGLRDLIMINILLNTWMLFLSIPVVVIYELSAKGFYDDFFETIQIEYYHTDDLPYFYVFFIIRLVLSIPVIWYSSVIS